MLCSEDPVNIQAAPELAFGWSCVNFSSGPDGDSTDKTVTIQGIAGSY